MHLKLLVLSASSVVLWIVPLAALDKTLDIHKTLQGVSLTAAIACAVTAGNIAREQAEQNEIEEIRPALSPLMWLMKLRQVLTFPSSSDSGKRNKFLTEYPGTENGRGEHQNAVVSCRLLVAVVIAVESQDGFNFLH
jgi:hypothetical protein